MESYFEEDVDNSAPCEEELFIKAIKNNNFVKVKELLEGGVDINCTHWRDEKTALHIASELGNKDLVTYLIEKGADINNGYYDDSAEIWIKPIHLAFRAGKLDIALLLAKGIEVNSGDNYLLHQALKYNEFDAVKLFIEGGIDINEKYGKYKPLFFAIKNECDSSIIQLLLAKGAKVGDKQKYDDYASSDDETLLTLSLLVDEIYNGEELKDLDIFIDSDVDYDYLPYSKEEFISNRLLHLILNEASPYQFNGNLIGQNLNLACERGYITEESKKEIQKGYINIIIDLLYNINTKIDFKVNKTDFTFLNSYPYVDKIIQSLIDKLKEKGLPSGLVSLKEYIENLVSIPTDIKTKIEGYFKPLLYQQEELDKWIIKIFYSFEANLSIFITDLNPKKVQFEKVLKFFANSTLTSEQTKALNQFQDKFKLKLSEENLEENFEYYHELYIEFLNFLEEEKVIEFQEVSDLSQSLTHYKLDLSTIKTFLLYALYPNYIIPGNVSYELLKDYDNLNSLFEFIKKSDAQAPETIELLKLLRTTLIEHELRMEILNKINSLNEPELPEDSLLTFDSGQEEMRESISMNEEETFKQALDLSLKENHSEIDLTGDLW